jgi:dTDP-4-amino-4,6-dideoxygalactose transaminase
MTKLLQALPRPVKNLVRGIAQLTIGRLPSSPARLTGDLAKDGGSPVRDVRIWPWANSRSASLVSWYFGVSRSFRQIFRSGIEGLPQPLATKFAQQWASRCGCSYGLLLSHGTDALRIALAAVLDHDGLDYGGEIIVPNFSFIASATAALDRRLGVAFVDIDPKTLLLDPASVEDAIVPDKTRAIMPVHLFGQPADMTTLGAIAKRHGLKIVEDAAQAHGASWESGQVGSLGHAAAFSFQSSKNLNCGEGGALTTNEEGVFERAYLIHNVGRARIGGRRWEHVALGWNCRPTEYQAALLMHRFELFDREQNTRRKNFGRLRELITEVECLEPLAIHPGVRGHGMHMFAMRYKPEHCGDLPVDEFLKAVQAEGAPIRRAFAATISDQPAIRQLMTTRPEYFRRLPTPVADQAAKTTVYIPHNVFLGGDEDMHDIVASVRKVEKHYGVSGLRARVHKAA